MFHLHDPEEQEVETVNGWSEAHVAEPDVHQGNWAQVCNYKDEQSSIWLKYVTIKTNIKLIN
jgi:MOSC domain-containing protein YiiM